MWQFLQRAYAEGGPIVRFRLAQNDMVLISGPEASEAFFRAPEDQLSNREAYKKSQTPVFGPGIIFDVPLETHMEQLQMMVGALKPQALRRYGDQIAAETRRGSPRKPPRRWSRPRPPPRAAPWSARTRSSSDRSGA